MPGVIMDHGSRDGSHTNHDRDQRHNGINGAGYSSEKQEKGKGRAEPQQNMTPTSPNMPNGVNGNFSGRSMLGNGAGQSQSRMNELPPEINEIAKGHINHITEGYMPLSMLLSRLSQSSHNYMRKMIADLAQMPLPASAQNGNGPHSASQDDTSKENQAKKQVLLDFATNTHERFLKALVITGWSKKAEEVSKAIDIKVHLDQEKRLYVDAIDDLAAKKRNLVHARLPNPDLKTAVHVLTTGKAPWMPDLGYLPPPALAAQDLLRTLKKLNTLLSMRLNLDDYDSIPLQFKNFVVKNGRVTFIVDGEFELDLTIADEEAKSQYWFIDLRFLFRPSASSLPPRSRQPIEDSVNDILCTDGLTACYKYLHETVLTYKISELKRQAVDLWRAKWNGTLKVESLNRGVSIQYWTDRYQGLGAKSWIIIGVHSGKPQEDEPQEKATSRLMMRWFRDQKEVPVDDLVLDTVNLSMEAVLNVYIAKHISHILTSIFDRLRLQPLYNKSVYDIELLTSDQDPMTPELKVQLTNERTVLVKIDPISGRFVLTPATVRIQSSETKLNMVAKDSRDPTGKKIETAIDKGYRILESLPYGFVNDDIATHGVTFGWAKVPDPGVKRVLLQEWMPKDSRTNMWLRRPGWPQEWYLLVCLNMAEIRWFMVRIIKQANQYDPNNPNALGIEAFLPLPIKTGSPTINYLFMSTLTEFAASVVCHYCNIKALYNMRTRYMLRSGQPSKILSVPSVYVKISELEPETKGSSRGNDYVRLSYGGVEIQMPNIMEKSELGGQATFSLDESSLTVTEARMVVPLPRVLASLKEKVDVDTAFNATTGLFAFRMRSKVGEAVIEQLVERISSIERLARFVKVLQKHEDTLKCDTVQLGKIIFNYGYFAPAPSGSDSMEIVGQTIRYRATVNFGTKKGAMTLVLEKGNPHLRISDCLRKILNSDEGLDGVATILKTTLPVLRAVEAIEDAWSDDSLSDKGEAFVTVHASDWYMIRYNLTQSRRKVTFEIKLRDRRGDPWWHIVRTDNRRTNAIDNLDTALGPLWTSKGSGWRGMRTNAVAQNSGAEDLLGKLDEVVRNFVLSGAVITPQQSVAAPPQQAPAAMMRQTSSQAQQAPAAAMRQASTQGQQPKQQHHQQMTPNQSQQSQGQGMRSNHKVIEID